MGASSTWHAQHKNGGEPGALGENGGEPGALGENRGRNRGWVFEKRGGLEKYPFRLHSAAVLEQNRVRWSLFKFVI